MDIGGVIGSIIAAPFYCIGWIIIGFIAGALARRLMGTGDASFASDIILGLIGALLGGFILSLIGLRGAFDVGLGIGSIVTALIGAIVVIFIGRALTGARR